MLMQRFQTSPDTALSFRIVYDSRRGVLEPASVTEYKVLSLKELRSIVCMAQGSPEEIPAHVMAFIQGNPNLRGETQVKIGEARTEVLK